MRNSIPQTIYAFYPYLTIGEFYLAGNSNAGDAQNLYDTRANQWWIKETKPRNLSWIKL